MVSWWPLIKIKLEVEYFGPQKRLNIDSLVEQRGEVSVEQVTALKPILVIFNVSDNQLNCPHLVVFECTVNSWSIEILHVFALSLLIFVPVEQWVVAWKMFAEACVQQVRHWARIKWQNRGHVSSVELQERLVENLWVWLVVNDVDHVCKGFADIYRLEQEQFTERDCMQVHFVQVPEGSFISAYLVAFYIFLRYRYNFVFRFCALELQKVIRIDFQKVVAF